VPDADRHIDMNPLGQPIEAMIDTLAHRLATLLPASPIADPDAETL
jgi:hypothetical protein